MISLRDVVTGFGVRDPLAEVWRRSLRGGGGDATEITGVPPLRYIGDGRPLADYLISGNALQDGTPSPDAPVDATGCGVRTGNLLFVPTTGSTVAPIIVSYASNSSEFIINKDVTSNNVSTNILCNIVLNAGTYTIKIQGLNSAGVNLDRIYLVDSNNIIIAQNITNNTSVQFTVAETTTIAKIAFVAAASSIYNNQAVSIMLNTGSTALPHEPYGYKLPLTVNGTEYPIYLGQVETTRRVKKLVFDGTESWYTNGSVEKTNSIYTYVATALPSLDYSESLCSHFVYDATIYGRDAIGFQIVPGYGSFRFRVPKTLASTASEMKAWVAQQYANGTPVTVWYVLAEPETAIVNEPLMKIGDYADTISFAQSQVAIPTVNGENVLDVPTEVPPSQITIKGGIRDV